VDVWIRRIKKDRVELTMIEPLMYEWKEIQPDLVVKGKVVRLETYGAFVDFGAERPGLIHVSELARGFVKTAGEVVKEGDEIEAKVLDVDRRKRQIRLSMKALQPEIVEEKPERTERAAERPERFDRPLDRDDRKSRAKPRKSKKRDETYEMDNEGPTEPQLTAMQVAWQEALDRSKSKDKAHHKSNKSASAEQEDILSRTLEKRIPTGG
jgi:small subunit ribosomal protein S1